MEHWRLTFSPIRLVALSGLYRGCSEEQSRWKKEQVAHYANSERPDRCFKRNIVHVSNLMLLATSFICFHCQNPKGWCGTKINQLECTQK